MTKIEWQKRNLPPTPDLVQTKRCEDIDKIISAELSDINDDPWNFETVKTDLIHDPCIVMNTDSPCMQDKKIH